MFYSAVAVFSDGGGRRRSRAVSPGRVPVRGNYHGKHWFHE